MFFDARPKDDKNAKLASLGERWLCLYLRLSVVSVSHWPQTPQGNNTRVHLGIGATRNLHFQVCAMFYFRC